MKSKVCMVILMCTLVMGFGLLLTGEKTMASEKLPGVQEQKIDTGKQVAEKEFEPGEPITIKNDTPSDVSVLVIGKDRLSQRSCGYIKSNKDLSFTTVKELPSVVFVLLQIEGSHLLFDGLKVKPYYDRVKFPVEPGTTLKVSEMDKPTSSDFDPFKH